MEYPADILSGAEPVGPTYPELVVELGMVLEDRFGDFVGDVVRWNSQAVTLRDRRHRLRHFTWKPGRFVFEGSAVTLVRPAGVPAVTQHRSASGTLIADRSPQVARPSRIWVEGVHDAELVEQVWGDDLRELGVVVEPMQGADDMAELVRAFAPGPDRRLGILLDHLVAGSKESRLAASVRHDHVLITGHRFVDVWAAVRPGVIGLDAWPEVPRDVGWKVGLCAALGVDEHRFWPRLRARVRSYADLDPTLVGAVEQLIDFVAEPPGE